MWKCSNNNTITLSVHEENRARQGNELASMKILVRAKQMLMVREKKKKKDAEV